MKQGAYMKKQRRRKRGKRILATVAFVLTVGSVATAICLAMFFGIEEIAVTGSLHYPPEELIKLSKITVGQNIFAIDTGSAEQNIYKNCPYIDSVKVRRLLPTSVHLVVVETTAAYAMVDSADHYTLLGKSGRVLEQINDVSTEGVPLIVGADFSQLPAGSTVSKQELDNVTKSMAVLSSKLRAEEISKEQYEQSQQSLALLHRSVEKLSVAQRLIESSAAAGFEEISYYDVGDDLSVSILYRDRILIELGSELELDYKLKFARTVIDELADNFTGTVDLTTAGGNQKAYTREQEIAPLMNKIYHNGYY